MYKCPNCNKEFQLPTCNLCNTNINNVNNIWQLTDMPNIMIDTDLDKYIGYDHIGANYSGGRKYLIEDKDASFSKVITNQTGNGIFLDLACGDGCFTVPSASNGTKIIAGDISNKMLEILQEKASKNNISLENVTLCRLNALTLPLIDESVNTVVANSVLHLISNPKKVISEIHRVLVKDGKFICKDDKPGKIQNNPYDNSEYMNLVNHIYNEYWKMLRQYDIYPKKYSWSFNRDNYCEEIFESKSVIILEGGNTYENTLRMVS